MDNQEFYVVGCYRTSYEANVVQTLLAANGVESQVINEEVSVLYPIANGGDFYVRVIANMVDKDKIEEVLKSGFDTADML